MNIEHYRQRLLELEREHTERIDRVTASARENVDNESAHDVGDESVVDELKEQQLAAAGLERTTLVQIREALARIENGTYGRCVTDGGPIEEKRLEAVPWTEHCLKHQATLEQAQSARTPTL